MHRSAVENVFSTGSYTAAGQSEKWRDAFDEFLRQDLGEIPAPSKSVSTHPVRAYFKAHAFSVPSRWKDRKCEFRVFGAAGGGSKAA